MSYMTLREIGKSKNKEKNANNAITTDQAKTYTEDEIETTGEAPAALKRTKKDKEALLKLLNKKGKVKSLTSDEVDQALDQIF